MIQNIAVKVKIQYIGSLFSERDKLLNKCLGQQKNWERFVIFMEVTQLLRTNLYLRFKDGSVPFVRMHDLGRYHATTDLKETVDKLSMGAIQKLGLKIWKPGVILIPRSGSVDMNHRTILGTDAIDSISFSQLGRINIPIPPLKTQKQIVAKLSAAQEYKNQLLAQKTKLKELFDSVLHKSMKGKL